MFINTMMLGTIISISSFSWIGMWMGLEINLLSIIPIMKSSKNMYSSEASIKYFLTQAMASLILLFSIILMMMKLNNMTSNLYILDMALLTKLGAAPFHFWFPEVMKGLSWMNCMILMTWQKIAPLMLILNNNSNKILIFSIISSLIISTIMSFNQTSLRKIMAFSSINHLAWMLSSSLISFNITMLYFLIYSILSFILVKIFETTKSFYLNQLMNIQIPKMIKISLTLNFMSLGGLPPFLGFFPKWMIINLMSNNFPLLNLILIFFTLIMLFIYIRLMMSSMIISHTENKLFKKSNFKMFTLNFLIISSLILCTMILT
uniref:NADH-ubiquinone oxidoreductase chain 2 n=1 Tax=Anthicidae sp. DPP-2018 TaxID=2136110 RepID=A0A343YV58_9CUCU|nr:NADH dehydrogenase subunit 2 [Anthicidae sp. DPP-2018]